MRPADPALPDHRADDGAACPDRRTVHASAVAIEGRALLIFGRSRSGKSRLAHALIAASRPARPVVLIGDDRILLRARAGYLTARPHPRIAGFIERRGLGIVALRYLDEAPVAALVEIGHCGSEASACDAARQNLPRLAIVDCHDALETAARVLRWWTLLRRTS